MAFHSLVRSKLLNNGFTLIEVIAAMAILSIVSTGLLANILPSLAKGRDSRRKQDLQAIAKTLESYYSDNNTYPLTLPAAGTPLLNPNITSVVYIRQMPGDPKTKTSYCYLSDGTYYKIFANLENQGDRDKFSQEDLQACGSAQYNYGIASSNVILLAGKEPGGEKAGNTNGGSFSFESQSGGSNNGSSGQNNPEKILEVSLTYNNSQQSLFQIDALNVKNGYPSSDNSSGDYYLVLNDENSSKLFSQPFSVPNTPLGPPPLPGEVFLGEQNPVLTEVNFAVTVAWNEKTKSVQINDKQGNVLASLDAAKIVFLDNQANYYSVKGDQVNPPKESFLNRFISNVKAQTTAQSYLDITFMGDQYSGNYTTFHADVSAFITQLLKYEPFKSRASQIYFHYIDNPESLGCYYSGRCVMCNNSKVIQAANTSGVPYDNIYVIVNNSTYGGCAYEKLAAGYNGSEWGSQVFVHELGHSFGLLADEYLAGNSHPIELNGKNCHHTAPPNPDWEGIVGLNSYYSGCNYGSWYRSSNDSIMRSINSYSYNPVSQKYLGQRMDNFTGSEIQITYYPTQEALLSPTPTIAATPTIVKPTVTPTPTPFTTTKDNQICTFNSFLGQRTLPTLPVYTDGVFMSGNDDRSFSYPIGIATDNEGYLYVSDSSNNRILKLTSAGDVVNKWGSKGNGNGEFNMSKGIAVDQSGSVYVIDGDYSFNQYFRVEKFDNNGKFLTKWGTVGSSNGQFSKPEYIAVDNAGNVYVSELGNSRIQKFDSNGNFLAKWGSYGSGNGQFSNPRGMAFDAKGYLYVADSGNHRIQVFDTNGNFIVKFGSRCETGQDLQYGACLGQFFYPADIAIDSSSNIFVLDRENNRIEKFNASYNFLGSFGSYAKTHGAIGKFRSPSDITIDGQNNIYIADYNRHNIQILDCN